MIYIILGTKGQFIKMFPTMKLLDQYKIPYKFIHTGQHFKIIEENRKLLGIRKPDIYITSKKNDLKNIWQFIAWAPKVLWNSRALPVKKGDYLLNHGDTESTLLSFLIGKLHRAKIIHIESGMRSGNYLEPFPEEIIRSFVDHFSDVRFCPFKQDAKNLSGRKNTYVLGGNTVFDSIQLALKYKPSKKIVSLKKLKYVVFLVHRKETLFVNSRIEAVLEILEMILKKGYPVIWPLHANTEYELRKKGYWEKVMELKNNYNLTLNYFYNYIDFMHLLKYCQFAATDGDGVQEETYFLNKPVLILRMVTDSLPGIGENAFISYLDPKKAAYFLQNFKKFKSKSKPLGSPSLKIIDYCRRLSP